jgi:hypothetical protein
MRLFAACIKLKPEGQNGDGFPKNSFSSLEKFQEFHREGFKKGTISK